MGALVSSNLMGVLVSFTPDENFPFVAVENCTLSNKQFSCGIGILVGVLVSELVGVLVSVLRILTGTR